MAECDVRATASIGESMNVAAGHVAEMTGAAMQAASAVIGCPVGTFIGKMVAAAGQAWADTAVHVANRDSRRLTQGT